VVKALDDTITEADLEKIAFWCFDDEKQLELPEFNERIEYCCLHGNQFNLPLYLAKRSLR
jgi:hypothetical protein